MKSLQIEFLHGSNQTGSHYSTENFPGINQFRLNPFRVLRLPVTATSKQGLWQAEKVLSLFRLNLPPQEPVPIPWLPGNNEMEVKKAAQKMEEPLQRLVEQLFWFDFERDPKGEILCEGLLQMDPQKLLNYLQTKDTEFTLESLPGFKEKEPSPQEVEDSTNNEKITSESGNYAVITERIEPDKLVTVFAHCINRANLQLLLALSLFHGIGPQMNDGEGLPKPKTCKPPTFLWKKEKKTNFSFIMNPHDLLIRDEYSSFKASGWKTLWIDALSGWSNIIANSHFLSYLENLVKELGDELLDEGAIDTLMNAIPTRLADILIGEIKCAFTQNSDDCVSILIDIAAKVSFNQRVWKAPFSLLISFFQTELLGLNCLLVEDSSVTVTEVQIYFKRVEKLNHKWKSIDPKNFLGLSQFVDDSILKGFNVITGFNYIIDNTGPLVDLLKSAVKMSHSKSLKEKINLYHNQISTLNPFGTCYFCNKHKSNSSFPLVIKSKPIIIGQDGEKNLLETQFAYVPRCKNCANFHQFIINVSITFVIISILFSISAFAGINWIKIILWGSIKEILSSLKEGDISHVLQIMICLASLGALFFLIPKKSISIVKCILGFLLVPCGHKPFYKLKKSEGYRNLLKKGYHVKDFDESKNAIQKTSKGSNIMNVLG